MKKKKSKKKKRNGLKTATFIEIGHGSNQDLVVTGCKISKANVRRCSSISG